MNSSASEFGNSAPHALLADIDRIYVINLAARTDRRAEMTRELRRIGLSFDDPRVILFPAIRPDGPAPFPSVGAHGCFLSHLGVLTDARDCGADAILVLEDDAHFTRAFLQAGAAEVAMLARHGWDIFYLGYQVEDALPSEEGFHTVPASLALTTAHAIVFRKPVIGPLVDYLEAMLARPAGDPAGGPMHVDGAYSWFRRAHPDFGTLLPAQHWAVQRSSASDIAEAVGWKRRLRPFLRPLRALRNRLH